VSTIGVISATGRGVAFRIAGEWRRGTVFRGEFGLFADRFALDSDGGELLLDGFGWLGLGDCSDREREGGEELHVHPHRLIGRRTLASASVGPSGSDRARHTLQATVADYCARRGILRYEVPIDTRIKGGPALFGWEREPEGRGVK